jgi:hypothetical protein
MTNIQTLEIVDLLKSLPSEKIDESTEWSDEDLQDVIFTSIIILNNE